MYFLGNLALARALGDFDYKKSQTLPAEHQIITSNPEVTEHQITEEDEFLIIACDGSSIKVSPKKAFTSNFVFSSDFLLV